MTTTVTTATKVTISAKAPVREHFAGRSTGSVCTGCKRRAPYYETKGAAVCAFDAALADHGYRFDSDDLASFPGDEGRRTLEVYDDNSGRRVGFAVLSWFRMESGRYEFTGYLA